MEKLTFSSLIVFAALTLAAGSAWHSPSSTLKRASLKSMAWGKAASSHLPSSWHRALSQQQQQCAVCGRLSWTDTTLNNGALLESGDVSVCTERSFRDGVCYFTNGNRLTKCCNNAEINLASSTLKVGSKDVFAEILYVGGVEFAQFCVHFSLKNIELCPPRAGCQQPFCQDPRLLCTNNSVSCDASECICKEGYKETDCCECEDNYIEHNGVCQFQCKTNCKTEECNECAHPYTDAPLCCNCTDPYIKVDGVCQCPNGTIEVNGTCETICQGNTVPCDSPPCCADGFKTPLCCECIFDETNEGFSYFKQDGKCEKICKMNADENKCDVNSGCSECLDFFKPRDCCECIEPRELVDEKCLCPDGTIEINGTCEKICQNNTVPCNSPPCCAEGFKAPLCCECIFDETEEGFSYFKQDGKCKKICKNANLRNCDVNSGCSECLNFFKPRDCCECIETKHLVDEICRDCPRGEVLVDGKCKEFCSGNIVPGSCDGTKCQCQTGYTGNDCCKCDQSQGIKILVNGKCIPVCDNVVGKCSETSCPCELNFASPDCCNCTDGSEPDNGVCKVPCIDTQNVFIVLDRSSGNSETEFTNAIFMTQMLAGAMLRSTKNVKVTVLAYAKSENSETLEELMPPTSSVPAVTEEFCLSKLIAIAKEIITHRRYKHTLADKTMELLKSYIQAGVPNTVITFSGIISDFQDGNPVFERIQEAINEMKSKNNVRFFSAGFVGENKNFDRYKNEVLALANNQARQSSINRETEILMKDLTKSLVNHGVLCQDQVDAIKPIFGQSAGYRNCQDNNAEIILFNKEYTPCINKPSYKDICRRVSTVKSFLLAMMNRLLMLNE